MSTPFAIFRIAKLKSKGNVSGCFSHLARSIPTPNADPNRTQNNVVFVGDKSKDILEAWQQKIDSLGVNVRSNAVHAVEVLITATPDYFRPNDPAKAGTWDKEKLSQWFEVQKKFIAEHFPHAIYAELQLDESTPHISIIDVPIIKKGKRNVLDTRTKYGGDDRRTGLANWQDLAGKAVEHLGIARGIPGSKAKHTTLAQYYTKANAPLETLPPAQPIPKPLPERTLNEKIPLTKANQERQAKEEKHAQAVKKARTHNSKRKQKAVEIVEKVQAKAQHADIAERKAKQATETAQSIAQDLKKAQANEMRALPMGEVLRKLYGGTLQKHSNENHLSKKFDVGGREVVITTKDTGEVWFIQDEAKGGKNAINFVMQFSGVDFSTALKMLSDTFGAEKTALDVAKRAHEKALADAKALKAMPVPTPEHDPTKQTMVEKYLNEVRKIPRKLIGQLFATGRLIADNIGNAVFPRWNGGAFKRGTRGKFYQSVGGKAQGAYVLEGKSKRTVFTESPIDALTLKAMEPESTIIALGGNLLTVDDVKHHAEGKTVVLAFDNDKAGKAFKAKFLYAFPSAETMTPPSPAKDWNEALQKGLVNADSSVSDPLPTLPTTPAKKTQQNSIASALRKPATP